MQSLPWSKAPHALKRRRSKIVEFNCTFSEKKTKTCSSQPSSFLSIQNKKKKLHLTWRHDLPSIRVENEMICSVAARKGKTRQHIKEKKNAPYLCVRFYLYDYVKYNHISHTRLPYTTEKREGYKKRGLDTLVLSVVDVELKKKKRKKKKTGGGCLEKKIICVYAWLLYNRIETPS